MNSRTALSHRYFQPWEWACRDRCGGGVNEMNYDFTRRLDLSRGLGETLYRVRSAYRCLAHNKAVHGVSNSAHLLGDAADIETLNGRARFMVVAQTILAELVILGFLAPGQARYYAEVLEGQGQIRIGIPNKDFVHLDIHPDKPAPWLFTY